jgi:hypothetical protein
VDLEKLKIMRIKESILKSKRASSTYRTTSEYESFLDTTSKDYLNDSLFLPSIIIGGATDLT